MWLPVRPGFSFLVLATLLTAAASGLLAGGCSSSSAPAGVVCGGVVGEDGKCYAKCDEKTDCHGTDRCVVAPHHPEGQCFPVCASPSDCALEFECVSGTAITGGDKLLVCVAASVLGTSPGQPGHACADDTGCDHGLSCLGGVCAYSCAQQGDCPAQLSVGGQAQGVYCDATSKSCKANGLPPGQGGVGSPCADSTGCDSHQGLTCVSGQCGVMPPGKAGDPCSPSAPCETGGQLMCLNGTCGVKPPGKLGEACSDTEPCAAGVGCFNMICRSPCQSVKYNTCGAGMQCQPAAGAGYEGLCVEAPMESGMGQYGTNCPNPAKVPCDTANGFVCIGAPGSADAYCSKQDGCTKDADCPGGYWCGETRTFDAKKNILFGMSPKVCLRRDFCAPCSDDVDCSFTLNAICVPDTSPGSTESFCSTPCALMKNSCEIGTECHDFGNGRTACVPEVGYCHAHAAPKASDPCRVDSDCGDQGFCSDGAFGYKPGIKWCSTPCGAADSFGKLTCPLAPNGQEMVCLDEHQLTLGGPFDSTAPDYVYRHCYSPFTVDDSAGFTMGAPPLHACGNGKREDNEECDDGNHDNNDGCQNDCTIAAKCTFQMAPGNSDATPLLTHDGVMATVPPGCRSFKVTGAIDAAGAVRVVDFKLPDQQSAWVDVYTDKPGSCSSDLMAEVRSADTGDLKVPCEKLSNAIPNVTTMQLCADGNVACGDCTNPGICGQCDDDNGYGDCPKLLANTSLTYGQYTVDFDSERKRIRIYARDKTATVANVILIVDRVTFDATMGQAVFPPGFSCY